VTSAARSRSRPSPPDLTSSGPRSAS
jgi:hypothetical protein